MLHQLHLVSYALHTLHFPSLSQMSKYMYAHEVPSHDGVIYDRPWSVGCYGKQPYVAPPFRAVRRCHALGYRNLEPELTTVDQEIETTALPLHTSIRLSLRAVLPREGDGKSIAQLESTISTTSPHHEPTKPINEQLFRHQGL